MTLLTLPDELLAKILDSTESETAVARLSCTDKCARDRIEMLRPSLHVGSWASVWGKRPCLLPDAKWRAEEGVGALEACDSPTVTVTKRLRGGTGIVVFHDSSPTYSAQTSIPLANCDIVSMKLSGRLGSVSVMAGVQPILHLREEVLSIMNGDTVDLMTFLRHLPFGAQEYNPRTLHYSADGPVDLTVVWRPVPAVPKLVCKIMGADVMPVVLDPAPHVKKVRILWKFRGIAHGIFFCSRASPQERWTHSGAGAVQRVTLLVDTVDEYSVRGDRVRCDKVPCPLPLTDCYYLPLGERVDMQSARMELILTFTASVPAEILTGCIYADMLSANGGMTGTWRGIWPDGVPA